MKDKLATLEEALAPVRSGCTLAVGGALLRRPPNAAIRALIRRGIRDLVVESWAATTAVDFLAAADAIRRWEGIYVGMFGYGLAPNFRRGVEEGRIETRDFSETAMVARLRAAAQGLPSLPIRTLFGSDVALGNPEQIKPYTCPISGQTLLAIAASRADVTILHGYVADCYGNVQWPIVRDSDDVDQMLAAAAKYLVVTVERIVPHEVISRRPALTYIPGQIVSAVVEVPYGAHPGAVDGFYDEDGAVLSSYLEQCSTAEGARAWLAREVTSVHNHDAYLASHGGASALAQLEVEQEVWA